MFMLKRLSLGLLLLVCALAMAYGGGGTDSDSGEKTAMTVSGEYTESPMLAALVAKGELPPIEERLPEEPAVIGPGSLIPEEWLDWEPGKHGGTMRILALGGWSVDVMLATSVNLFRGVGQSTEDPAPFLVSDYKIEDDYKKFTFTIRKGLKWSDGVPVTTEDVRFTYEDYWMNKQVQPAITSILKTQGNPWGSPMELEIVDDLTFIIRFDKRYGYFMAELTSWIPDYTNLITPSHYLKQFHADYTDEAEIEPFLKDGGFEKDEWWKLIANKNINHWASFNERALGTPVLNPWVLTSYTPEKMIMTRNPYYAKVDVMGNQLPYIDTIDHIVVNENETMTMKIIAGEVDLMAEAAQLPKMTLYKQNEDKEGYRVVMTGAITNPPLLFLNHDYDYESSNSVWQSLVADSERRFGEAVALAIDFDDINKALYYGLYGEPIITPAEFDQVRASQLLDELGMDKKDSEGFRLGPDGKRFEFVITPAPLKMDNTLLAELIKEHLEDVGIRTDVNVITINLFNTQKSANELMATIHWSDQPIWHGGISVDYLPNHKGGWAPASWAYYISEGAEGRKPPTYIQEFFDLHDARKEFAPGSPEGKAAYAKLENWFSENYVFIFPTGTILGPNIVADTMGNIPKENYPYDLDLNTSAEQFFYK